MPDVQINKTNPISASAIGSGVNVASSVAGTLLNYGLQKRLTDYQYNSYMENARKAGATPAAIAQGITNSPSSVPSVSSSSLPAGDVASNMVAASNVDSENSRRKVLSDIDLAKLPWDLRKLKTDISEGYSRIALNKSQKGLNYQLRDLYREQEKDIRLKRPWQISEMAQGINNAIAIYDKILAETSTIKKQGSLYDSQSSFYGALTSNENLKRARYQFDAIMLRSGWDINSNWYQNIMRNAFNRPDVFKSFWNNSSKTLQYIDGKLMDNFGKNYKRNFATGYAGYRMLNYIGKVGLQATPALLGAPVVPSVGRDPSADWSDYWWLR